MVHNTRLMHSNPMITLCTSSRIQHRNPTPLFLFNMQANLATEPEIAHAQIVPFNLLKYTIVFNIMYRHFNTLYCFLNCVSFHRFVYIWSNTLANPKTMCWNMDKTYPSMSVYFRNVQIIYWFLPHWCLFTLSIYQEE